MLLRAGARRGIVSSRQQSQSLSHRTIIKRKKSTDTINAPRKHGRDDDSLARYPQINTPGGILRGLDYAGTLTFALTGSVTAAQSGLDVFGCAMIGMVTAVGGGTIRDAVFLSKRPFWTSETEYIWMTVITGCLTFFAWPILGEWREQQRQQQQGKDSANTSSTESISSSNENDIVDVTLDTLDAIGLSAFAIIGAQNGVRAGMPMVVSVSLFYKYFTPSLTHKITKIPLLLLCQKHRPCVAWQRPPLAVSCEMLCAAVPYGLFTVMPKSTRNQP